MSDFYDHRDNWYRIELDLNEHKDDTIKHITDTERQNWNAKSDAHGHPYAPLSHVGDDTHVTSTEKSTWNGKATASDIATAINTHETSVAHGYLVPNWSEAVVVTGSDNVAQYTAPTHGIIYVTNNMNSQSNACDVYVNGVLVSQMLDGGGHVGAHTYAIASGDTIKFDCSRIGTIYFLSELTDMSDVQDIPSDSLYILFVPFKTV